MMSNFKNNSWFYLIAGLLITANIVTLTLLWLNRSGNDQHPQGPPHSNLFEYLTKELDLNKQQQEAYRNLRDEHQHGTRDLQDSIRKAKDALFILLQQDSVSEEAISAQSNRAAAFHAQLDNFTFHHFQKVRAICNPSQQKKFDEIIQEALRTQGPGMQGPPGNRPPPPHNR